MANPLSGNVVISGLFTNIEGSFQGLWQGLLNVLPNIVLGIIILIVGWLVAIVVSSLVGKFIKVIRLDNVLASAGVKGFFQQAGIKLNIDKIFEEVVKWFILVAFFMSAARAFGLPEINNFLSQVLDYIPNVIIASVIMIAGVLIANFVADLAHGTAKATKAGSPHIVSTIVRYAVIVFTIMVALNQLKIGAEFLKSFFTAASFCLAGGVGLAFGLGGKDAAADLIAKVRKDIGGHKK